MSCLKNAGYGASTVAHDRLAAKLFKYFQPLIRKGASEAEIRKLKTHFFEASKHAVELRLLMRQSNDKYYIRFWPQGSELDGDWTRPLGDVAGRRNYDTRSSTVAFTAFPALAVDKVEISGEKTTSLLRAADVCVEARSKASRK